MRISDWSSDVCSSDLPIFPARLPRNDAELVEFVRAKAETVYHPVGTCRMGSDDAEVVDPQLRVRGIEGLRVVDASVLPTLPTGNTNAPTIMIAERAAEQIGRAHVRTPVTHEQLVCRLLLEHKKSKHSYIHHSQLTKTI